MSDDTLSQEALDALLAELGDADEAIEIPDSLLESPGADSSLARAAEEQAVNLNLVSFDQEYSGPSGAMEGFERVQDIPLEISVELGRTRLLIRDILELGVGSIIELEKMAGEPVDLLANGLLVARGEVVVIEDNFGVRITEIITPAERNEAIKAERNAHA